jgi:hypothetical protein
MLLCYLCNCIIVSDGGLMIRRRGDQGRPGGRAGRFTYKFRPLLADSVIQDIITSLNRSFHAFAATGLNPYPLRQSLCPQAYRKCSSRLSAGFSAESGMHQSFVTEFMELSNICATGVEKSRRDAKSSSAGGSGLRKAGRASRNQRTLNVATFSQVY